MTGFSLSTAIGEIQSANVLPDEEVAIFRNSHIPFVSTIFRVKINEQNSLDVKQEVYNVIEKMLRLTSFTLTAEHKWVFLQNIPRILFCEPICVL